MKIKLLNRVNVIDRVFETYQVSEHPDPEWPDSPRTYGVQAESEWGDVEVHSDPIPANIEGRDIDVKLLIAALISMGDIENVGDEIEVNSKLLEQVDGVGYGLL